MHLRSIERINKLREIPQAFKATRELCVKDPELYLIILNGKDFFSSVVVAALLRLS